MARSLELNLYNQDNSTKTFLGAHLSGDSNFCKAANHQQGPEWSVYISFLVSTASLLMCHTASDLKEMRTEAMTQRADAIAVQAWGLEFERPSTHTNIPGKSTHACEERRTKNEDKKI